MGAPEMQRMTPADAEAIAATLPDEVSRLEEVL